MTKSVFLTCCFLFAMPSWAQQPILPKASPPTITPYAQTETHRIRIVNAVDGPIQVSTDEGKTWHLVGRVTAPATDSLMGYLASGYAAPGTVSATAVHGIRIRVGELGSAYPKLINIVPREFAATPKLFGGHISGLSGIYTNIPVGTSIFRNLAPRSGDELFLESGDGTVTRLPLNYKPQENDVVLIISKRPDNPLKEVDFKNTVNGKVTATYADGTTQFVASVIKPVLGVGRFDGTSYTGVGAINTNHSGVITVSTAPVTTSTLFEGTGDERRGGFQIEPAYHNSQSDEAGAPMILVVGQAGKKRQPDQEGKPPLFHGYFDLNWNPQDMRHSWRAEVRKQGSGDKWLPMPQLMGFLPNALSNVTAIRLIQDDPGDIAWRNAQIAVAEQTYLSARLQEARAGKLAVQRGHISVNANGDARTMFVAFYIDGAFRGITNHSPYALDWNTTDSPDGEYVVEARAEDANGTVLSTTRTKFWIDNQRQVAAR